MIKYNERKAFVVLCQFRKVEGHGFIHLHSRLRAMRANIQPPWAHTEEAGCVQRSLQFSYDTKTPRVTLLFNVISVRWDESEFPSFDLGDTQCHLRCPSAPPCLMPLFQKWMNTKSCAKAASCTYVSHMPRSISIASRVICLIRMHWSLTDTTDPAHLDTYVLVSYP